MEKDNFNPVIRRKPKNIIKVLAVTIILITGYLTANFLLLPKNDPANLETKVVKTNQPDLINRHFVVVADITSEKETITKEELISLAKDGKINVLAKDKKNIAGFLNQELTTVQQIKISENELGILRVQDLTPNYKPLNFEGKSFLKDSDYSFYIKTEKEKDEKPFDKSKVIKMTTAGDIILGRTVYSKMRQLGYTAPFKNVAEKLKNADITFANLETPLSDLANHPTEGMSFSAPKAAIEGLTFSGIDIVGLANNHSTNFGVEVFADFLKNLEESKIQYVGAGMNILEAKQYKIVKVKGKKFAFLDANSIIGDIEATKESAGTWHINIPPWSEYNQANIDELLEQVKQAKKESDYVIPMIHWGKEYTHDPSDVMQKLAHDLIDSGAEMVVGTHPHWTQGTEVYKSKFIAYSLGNFVFDQEWSRETKEGLIMDSYFYEGKLISTALTPVLIEDYYRPRILNSNEGKTLMDAVWESTKKLQKVVQ